MQVISTPIKPLSLTFILLLLMSVQVAFSQHTLGLDKSGKVKRIHYYAGDHLKIKLLDKEKVSGRLDAIFDSSFVIDGRKILLSEVSTVYSTRKAMRFLGGALMVSGTFYFGIDAINNILNYNSRGYIVSNSVWLPSAIMVGTGGILYLLSVRRTKVTGKGNFRIFNTTPIPIITDTPNTTDE